MPIPKSKTELIAAIETTFKKLYIELESISDEKAALIELEGHAKGTSMNIENLVAYLIGWGELVLKWNDK